MPTTVIVFRAPGKDKREGNQHNGERRGVDGTQNSQVRHVGRGGRTTKTSG